MDRKSFLVIAASAAGLALSGGRGVAVLARPAVERSSVVRARLDRQWMTHGAAGCAGSRKRSRFGGTDRVAIARPIPAPRA